MKVKRINVEKFRASIAGMLSTFCVSDKQIRKLLRCESEREVRALIKQGVSDFYRDYYQMNPPADATHRKPPRNRPKRPKRPR